jgi:hypothetical protein
MGRRVKAFDQQHRERSQAGELWCLDQAVACCSGNSIGVIGIPLLANKERSIAIEPVKFPVNSVQKASSRDMESYVSCL